MQFYISDTHFGDRESIGFDHRPFKDCGEMEQVLIYLWNDRVERDDNVWILGDFCRYSDVDPVHYLRKLKGKKNLIIGNHDRELLKNERAMSYFETVQNMHYIQDAYKRETIDILLCHYPIA